MPMDPSHPPLSTPPLLNSTSLISNLLLLTTFLIVILFPLPLYTPQVSTNSSTKHHYSNNEMSTNTTNVDEIRLIHPIPQDRYDDIISHLRSNFFLEEPLNKAVGLSSPNVDLEATILDTLHENLSIVALRSDTKQVVGAVLNGIIVPGDISKAREKLQKSNDEKFKKIFTFLYKTNEKVDIFNRFKVDKIFEGRILSVDGSLRGYGIGKRLLIQSEELARRVKCKIWKLDVTGIYSQRIAESHGFETIYELQYETEVTENGKPLFNIPAPHKSFKVVVKFLD